jgi:predicted DCC family thiol-disulfide oxidoreductase YuxK
MTIQKQKTGKKSTSQAMPAKALLNKYRDLKSHSILFDASCRVCTASVKFLQAKTKKDVLDFIPLQSDIAETILKYYIPTPSCDSVIFIHKLTDEKWMYYTKSDALINCAALLNFPWSLLKLFVIVPRRIRDSFYELFARHRYKIFSASITCELFQQ